MHVSLHVYIACGYYKWRVQDLNLHTVLFHIPSGYRTVAVRTFVVAAALIIAANGNSTHTSSLYGLRALCCLSAPREAVHSWVGA